MIRAARPDEWPELTRLANAAKAFWGYAESDMVAWRDDLQFCADSIRDLPTFVVDNSHGMPCAVLQLDTRSDPWAIGALWVDPAAMRQGHGRALMGHAAAYTRRCGQFELAIDADPNAQAFYRAVGARPTGVVPAPIVGDPGRVRPQLVLQLADATADQAKRPPPLLQRMSRDAAPGLQVLYDACADYFVHAQGEPAHAGAALDDFDDVPEGLSIEAKIVLAAVGADGACAAMIEGLRDYPHTGAWYLGLMMVRPDLRSCGLGSRLVRDFEDIARSAGAGEIRLCVFDDRPRALVFWLRNGYRFYRAVAGTPFGTRLQVRTELHKMLVAPGYR